MILHIRTIVLLLILHLKFNMTTVNIYPGTALALNFRVTFYRRSKPTCGVLIYYLLRFVRGLSNACSSGLPPEKPRNTLSQNMVIEGSYLLLRPEDRTAVSLNRTSQCALLCRTSSSSCFDHAPDSSPPYGRSQGNGSIGPPPFSCGHCRMPTRSQ